MATLTAARRVVIKIGSALLVDRVTGQLRADWLHALAEDVSWLKGLGCDVVLVSSGSIALGRGVLGLPRTTLALEQSQAAAAVGQIRLARAYEEALQPHGITTAQVLVTLEDSADRRRYLNSRATMETLLGLGVVPIVNENDTVATDEIRFGDNDRLAAQIAVTVGADQLILLSDVDGFYSGNPSDDPEATRYDTIEQITPEIEAMAGDAGSGLSKGGMKTKLMAATNRHGGGLRNGDHRRLRAAPAAGPAERGECHLVYRPFRPAGGPQALDRRDETAWFRNAGCGCGGGNVARQIPAACRHHGGDRHIRAGGQHFDAGFTGPQHRHRSDALFGA